MKSYQYTEDHPDDKGNPIVQVYTEQEILDEFYDHWAGMMVHLHGDTDYRIRPENCIADWVKMHLAKEVID